MPASPLEAPPASGTRAVRTLRTARTSWDHVPARVRDAVADVLGAPVATAATQRGGFPPGVAARVGTAEGRRAFVKAAPAAGNPLSPWLHRDEARRAAALPAAAAAPRLLGSYDDGDWAALVFEDIEGHPPHVPWRADELTRVLGAVHDLATALTPAPGDAPAAAELLAESFRGWQALAAADDTHGLDAWAAARLPALAELSAPWARYAAGDTLAHGDLRADNILLTPDGGVVFVDWPHAARAAAWFDLLLMLPCVRAQGGPPPEDVFTAHPLARDADPDGVTAVLAALAGFFLHHSRLPAPPGLPTVRAFQHAQGVAALGWLRTRLAARPVAALE
ncbi:phosphotransferase family protein [Streptomyces sp. NPDC050560]|uniref:phosphotransferase family protein n=1 Tax=Streptomyces sp. NPDC050560 TaxID=3365630 RepID=UPI0037B01980